MKIQRLQTLVLVAASGSVRRAALRGQRSAAGLMAHITALEAELGFPLLQTGTAGGALTQSLTQAGEFYAAQAKLLIDAIERARGTALRIAEGVDGELRLGICEEVATPRLTQLLRSCRERLSGLRISLVDLPSAGLGAALRRHEINFALLLPQIDEEGIVIEPVWQEEWRVVLPPGHFLGLNVGEEAISCEQLADIGLILSQPDLSPTGHDLIRAVFHDAGVRPRIAAQVMGRPTMLMLVSAGAGATFAPASFFGGLSHPGQPIAMPFKAPPLTIAAAFHRHNPPGSAMQFLRVLREAAAGFNPPGSR